MLAFISFIVIMSITPGPNTIMAMVSGQTRGFAKSWQLNLGMAVGMGAIGIVAGLFADWLQHTPTFIGAMKVIGSAYLLYLAYHVAVSRPDHATAESGAFTTGLLLQLTNIKVYLYFITGLGAFSLPGILSTIPARWALMVIVGSLGTFLWTGGGQLINAFYQKHFRVVNSFVALLLVFSAIDLWR
ncbi:LysE family transporter [Lacticaseibacillus porcinae]|uniref:LysE family transporter n=1 Tax=Lacticaseibacillus porcinae TaxID=1123687 RepID=UPI000F7A0186|nr:LysE family transporter [Lacticaseibacillus porcinae]